MNIHLVPFAQVDATFPYCELFFQQAIKRGGGDDLTVPYLWSECRSGRAFLYVHGKEQIQNAMILRFENPDIARILVMGGDGGLDWMEEIEALGETIKNHAKKLVFQGRKGWQRKLPNTRIKAVVYEKELA